MTSVTDPDAERPRYRRGRPVLTRASIGRVVLDLTVEGGAAAVTMRSLAERLQVTPRALYKVVADRSDALVAASVLAQGEWVIPPLDPADWEASVALACRVSRAWYLRYPGLLALAASADITGEVHPQALVNNERVFGLLMALGLSPRTALNAWELIIGSVAGFVEVEHWEAGSRRAAADSGRGEEVWEPTPERLLAGHPGLDLTHTRAVAAAAAEGTVGDRAEERFADVVEMLVEWIRRRLPAA